MGSCYVFMDNFGGSVVPALLCDQGPISTSYLNVEGLMKPTHLRQQELFRACIVLVAIIVCILGWKVIPPQSEIPPKSEEKSEIEFLPNRNAFQRIQ